MPLTTIRNDSKEYEEYIRTVCGTMVEAAEEKIAGRRHGEEDRQDVQEIDFFSHMERKIDRLFKKSISFWLLLCSIICSDCVYFLIPSTVIRVHRCNDRVDLR
ncbi:hypothetical protein L1887_35821 [Cichorium endivia]|nr:hypothetical protein L1887_35821 [Cichorium endivia]